MGKKIMFSSSSLGIFTSCKRCFWLDKVMGIKREAGIFPSLPSGMDGIFKVSFDSYRKLNKVPSSIEANIPGHRLYSDMEKLNKYRNWRSGLRFETDNFYLTGALDDLLVTPEGRYTPFDYKTKGSEPKDDHIKYYQTQLDIYAFLLRENGFPLTGDGYIVVYYPIAVEGEGGAGIQVKMGSKFIKTSVNPDAIPPLLDAAYQCLIGPMPESADDCEYCKRARDLRSKQQIIKTAVKGIQSSEALLGGSK